MTDQHLRWGFLSTAGIGRKNWKAISLSGNGIVAGVASRSADKARIYINDCQREAPFPILPKAYGSYEEILADPDIDAVYAPLPTGIRTEWIVKAAEAGKHVLGEKPAGVNAAEVEQCLAACKANNVHYMDGVMFVHGGRLQAFKKAAKERIGTLRHIATAFSFCGPEGFMKENIRSHAGLEPLGCLGDLGWYTIRLILELMDGELPKSARATMLSEVKRADSPDTVPTQFSAELLFANGVSATYYNSFITTLQQWAMVSGTEGYLHMDDYVLPYYGYEAEFFHNNAAFNTYGCDNNMENARERIAVPEYSNGRANAQEANMMRNFAEQVRKGSPDPSWGEWTLKTQRVLDASLESARNGGRSVEL